MTALGQGAHRTLAAVSDPAPVDPSLGIEFPAEWVEQAASQAAIVVRPSTWTNYERIAALGRFPDRITRLDLARQAALADVFDDDRATGRLFVMTMMWGSGTRNGRGPRNTDAALSTDRVLDTLREARARVLDGDAGGAYDLYKRIDGLGPSFLTKWLWVVGSMADVVPRPLIQDERVWSGLGKLGWDSLRAAGRSRFWSHRYVAYLEACRLWAAQRGVEPEDIEYSLFQEGA